MTPPPPQSPSTRAPFFDKMCHNQCATCRFIHINFCNLYIQRQDCYFGNFMLHVVCLHLERRGEMYGVRRVGREWKEIKSVPWATSWGVFKETKCRQEGPCPPFAQRSLPAQAWRWQIYCCWPTWKAMNSYCEEESGVGAGREKPLRK